jgi:HAD superfamily hydrolase (TIGR01509 family)
MIEAVLFDLGDTLIHLETEEAGRVLRTVCRTAYDELVKLGHHPPPYDAYIRAIKRRFVREMIWARLIRREIRLQHVIERSHVRMGIELDSTQITDLTFRFVIPAMRQLITVNPEAQPVIATLSERGFRLGLVSNTPYPGWALDEFLKGEGWLDYLAVRVYSSEVGHMKPQRRIFLIALERLGVPPERTLYVGDRVDKDVLGASRVGMKTVLFLHEDPVPRLRARPDHMVRKLSDLPALLEDLKA